MHDIIDMTLGKDNLYTVSIQEFSIDPDTQSKVFSGKIYTASLNKERFEADPQGAIDCTKAVIKKAILADRKSQQDTTNALTAIKGLITPEDFETFLNQ